MTIWLQPGGFRVYDAIKQETERSEYARLPWESRWQFRSKVGLWGSPCSGHSCLPPPVAPESHSLSSLAVWVIPCRQKTKHNKKLLCQSCLQVATISEKSDLFLCWHENTINSMNDRFYLAVVLVRWTSKTACIRKWYKSVTWTTYLSQKLVFGKSNVVKYSNYCKWLEVCWPVHQVHLHSKSGAPIHVTSLVNTVDFIAMHVYMDVK